ncbi:hypothetical protein HYH03_001154 [Edaphochlamys debaryana]|uniref:Uncharacterized protein n=1 Tax=Edaphochlamys debaryana TaxID=47281 RepID=A0A835YPB0_9CHLO|nr:hypothetical protein HYH03_001154 [Edaphochlamys debaryana]|eukprot:KAG2501364.1 hypothetical protein HYH03_001154 [Edaphochlamys debaryana]
MYRPQRPRYFINGRKSQQPSPSQALGWALGMLRRGRRPGAVHIEVSGQPAPECLQGVLDLLRAIPQLSGRPGEGVAFLELPAQLLSPSTAPFIAGAFPNLARLELALDPKVDASREAARGLALLLGAAPGAEGGGATAAVGGGEEAGGGPNPASLLPRLTALCLAQCHGCERLPPGFGPMLRQASQLRTLEMRMHFGESGSLPEIDTAIFREPLEELASLTQLTALSLYSCAVPLLPVLTGALTRLTSLELSYQHGSVSPAVFAPLQGLQRLEVPCASLEVTGLAEALSSLTRLSVGGFTFADEAAEKPLTRIPRWRLPAGLRELGLGADITAPRVPPEALAGLDLHPGLCLDPNSAQGSFVLHPGRHTAPPVVEDDEEGEEDGFAGTALLPAAEEALCAALSFVRRHGLDRKVNVDVTFEAEVADLLLQPVGGAAGTGPGRPNHGRWLRAVAALGPSHLWLKGINLSYQDVEALRDGMAAVKDLVLEPPCELPLPALPLLAGLPHLDFITLDATPWAEDNLESSELRGQALASIVALSLARPQGRDLQLDLCVDAGVSRERVRAMGVRVRECMRAWGVQPPLIMVNGYSVKPETDAEESDEEQ